MVVDGVGGVYLWLKALHIISVIAWMVGLLYLPRLFVYHCDAPAGSLSSETFKVMERRLYWAIMTPAMLATWLFGLGLLASSPVVDWSSVWVHLKLFLVVIMTGLHGIMARWQRDFADDANRHSARFYRILNEVPTVLMIAIVLTVTIKPF